MPLVSHVGGFIMTTSDKPSTIGQSNLRYYWIIFGVLLISFAFPVRILSNWWINPILYGLLTLACFLTMSRFIRRYYWKQMIVVVMLACTVLSGLHGLISLSEIDNCWVEDIRYTQLIVCDSGGQYQQIESLPVGMQGYCYYCPWY